MDILVNQGLSLANQFLYHSQHAAAEHDGNDVPIPAVGYGSLTKSKMCVNLCYMKTATIREAQHNLSRVLRWVEHGETVEITRRKKTIAKIVPAQSPPKKIIWPDRLAELRAIYGDKPIPGKPISQIISEDREDRF